MKTLFTLACCFIALMASAQNTFETSIFSSSHTLSTQGIIQLKDCNYLVLCSGAHYTGSFVIKINTKGSIINQKTIGLSEEAITATSDGGFATITSNYQYPLFARYDSSLNQEIAKIYTYPVIEGANFSSFSTADRILQTADGSFLIAGTISDYHEDAEIYIFKIKNDGTYVANSFQTFETYPRARIENMIITNDGGVVMLCSSPTTPNPNPPVYSTIYYLLKTTASPDDNSSPHWARSINPGFGVPDPATPYDAAVSPRSLFPTSDSGFIFTADIDGNYAQPGSESICKVDANGNFIWAKSFRVQEGGSSLDIRLTGMVETKDSGYVLTGNHTIFGVPNDTANAIDTAVVYLIKLEKDGTLQWNKTLRYRDSLSTTFANFISTSDGGFAAAGNFGNSNVSSSDVAVYKFDNAFNTCNPLNTNANFPVEDIGFILSPSDGFASGGIATLGIATTSLVQTTTALHSFSLCSNVLPVQLLSFNAVLQNKTVNIEWKTANETNTNYFVVERSSDSRTFTSLKKISAKGNNLASVETYASNDLQPMKGTSYYRLQQVDKEGAVTYSNIVPVTVLANGTVVVSPNPVHDNVKVNLQTETNAQATFLITDLSGKILTMQNHKVVNGMNVITIPAASLSKGVYVLKVMQNKTVQTIKFIKQ